MLLAPVNSRWSKGRAVNACATSTPPVTTTASCGAKFASISDFKRSDVRGVNSDGFSMTELPAAKASAIGPMAR